MSRNTYDQNAIDSRKVRRSIAHLILEKNQSQEEVQRTASMRRAGRVRRRKKKSLKPNKRQCTREEEREIALTDRRRQANSEVVEGANPTRQMVNRKRSAISVADESAQMNEQSQRALPPAKKSKAESREGGEATNHM